MVLTGFKDEALAVKAVQEGAQDYLFKGQVDDNLLTRSLRYAIERKRAQEALREMEVEAARLAYLEESRRRILAAQEQVRKEIAQELHGPVQTRLLVLQQRMQGISKRLDTPTGDVRREIAELADQLGDVRENQIRSISHRLHPSIIAMGVAASLRSLRDHLERAILIELEIDTEVAEMEGAGLSSISEEVRLGLYRVAEEALANVLKHSKATKAFVRLGTGPEPETLLLSIADDGEGFEPENTVRGLGFTTIDDYLGALGGSFTLETAPGRGTRITVTIPLRHAPGGQPGQTTS